MAERFKFQFRMRDSLTAMALIGMALGLAMVVWRASAIKTTLQALLWFTCYLYAAACFGAGVGCVFRRAGRGAMWGLLMAIALPAFGFVVFLVLLVTFELPL